LNDFDITQNEVLIQLIENRRSILWM